MLLFMPFQSIAPFAKFQPFASPDAPADAVQA